MSAPLPCKNSSACCRSPLTRHLIIAAATVWLVVGLLAGPAMALILIEGPGYTRTPGPAPTSQAPTTPAPVPTTPGPEPTTEPTPPPPVGDPCNIFDPECPGSTAGSTGG